MKFVINVNQKAIIDSQLRLDLVDGAIMDFCVQFAKSGECKTEVLDGETYYWFSHVYICQQLPILGLKPDSMYRRMIKNLCESKVLKAHPNNKQHNRSWYTYGDNAHLLDSTIGPKSDGTPKESDTIGSASEPSDENPIPIGSKSEGPSEQNPMYTEITDQEIIINSSQSAPAYEAGESVEEVEAEEVFSSGFDDPKKDPNPRSAAPLPQLSAEDEAELAEYRTKLQANRRLLEGLRRLFKFDTPTSLDWIDRYVFSQWTANNLKGRHNNDLIAHCQNWIDHQLNKQHERDQRQSTPANRGGRDRRQTRSETGAEIDRLADEYFGTQS